MFMIENTGFEDVVLIRNTRFHSLTIVAGSIKIPFRTKRDFQAILTGEESVFSRV